MKKSSTQIDLKRRSFLKLSGLLGISTVSSVFFPAEKVEAFLFNRRDYKVTKTRLAMGTFVAMTAIHSSKDEAEHAIGLAFEEIDRLNGLLTHFEKSSPIGNLNESGKLDEAPAEVLELITRSLYYYRETGGAFDVTVKPLIDLYKSSFAAGNVPDETQIAKTLKLVGTENLYFRTDSLQFTKSGMAITLDGIAKGYIVDKASEVLSANGLSNHLINAGGDIRTCGSGVRGRSWTVAVQDPNKSKEYPDVISLKDGAIATSGNYEIYYDREKLFHHIVDGRTGFSPQLSTSVTVVAPTVMDADALSTSVFVMEPTAGVQFINGQPECECFVIARDGIISRSNGWRG